MICYNTFIKYKYIKLKCEYMDDGKGYLTYPRSTRMTNWLKLSCSSLRLLMITPSLPNRTKAVYIDNQAAKYTGKAAFDASYFSIMKHLIKQKNFIAERRKG